jgi:hypothetical protein
MCLNAKCLTQNLKKWLELLILKKRNRGWQNSLYSNFKVELKCEIKETSKFYITARKASISTTFDELTCQALMELNYLEGRESGMRLMITPSKILRGNHLNS